MMKSEILGDEWDLEMEMEMMWMKNTPERIGLRSS
jgi:hypothetical protein